MKGASQRVDTLTRQTLTSDIIMSPTLTNSVDNATEIVQGLLKHDGIAAATSTYQVGNRVTMNEHSTSTTIIAIDPDTYNKVFQNTLASGSALSSDSSGVLVGVQTTGAGLSGYKYDTSLHGGSVGDKISLQLQNSTSIDAPIEGVVDNNFKQADSRTYISLRALAKVMPTAQNKASTFYIKVNTSDNIDTVLDSLRSSYPDYQIQLGTSSTGIDDQIGTINLISAMLGAISLVVAAIMIFTVTYVDLTNRKKLIGIERAIGITTAAIQMSYIIRTVVAVIIGLAVGAVLYIAVLIPLSQAYPFSFPNGPVSLVAQHKLMVRYSYLLALSALIATIVPTVQILRAKLIDVIWGNS